MHRLELERLDGGLDGLKAQHRKAATMPDLYTLDGTGAPVRCADWATWAATDFRVARTEVGPGYVSTLFLGWTPARQGDGPPLLFETMVIGIEGIDWEERHPTRAAALAGHARAVAAAHAVMAAEVAEALGVAVSPPLDAA
jgi:hypothetical protein